MPIVVGALGATAKLESECKMLGIERDVGWIQRAAPLGTNHMLQKTFNTPP